MWQLEMIYVVLISSVHNNQWCMSNCYHPDYPGESVNLTDVILRSAPQEKCMPSSGRNIHRSKFSS